MGRAGRHSEPCDWEAPYSEKAYYARIHLAERDENGEWIHDRALRFERLEPLVAYHPNYPDLLEELVMFGGDIYPELAIHYGLEALKYVDMYPMDSGHGAYPENIHNWLGDAYQYLGDYSAALAHYRESLRLVEAYPYRGAYLRPETPRFMMNRILAGKPHLGPLAQRGRAADVDGLPVRAPVEAEPVSEPQNLPSIQPGDPLSERPADDADLAQPSKNEDVAKRKLAQQQAQKMMEQAQKRTQQEKQRFETFVKQLHRMASIKTEADFEKFLTQELVKQLEGSKPAAAPGPRPSAERMRRAAQIFRNAKTPAEGMKKLQEVDPDFANTLRVR